MEVMKTGKKQNAIINAADKGLNVVEYGEALWSKVRFHGKDAWRDNGSREWNSDQIINLNVLI
jgi:hypothetical protein